MSARNKFSGKLGASFRDILSSFREMIVVSRNIRREGNKETFRDGAPTTEPDFRGKGVGAKLPR